MCSDLSSVRALVWTGRAACGIHRGLAGLADPAGRADAAGRHPVARSGQGHPAVYVDGTPAARAREPRLQPSTPNHLCVRPNVCAIPQVWMVMQFTQLVTISGALALISMSYLQMQSILAPCSTPSPPPNRIGLSLPQMALTWTWSLKPLACRKWRSHGLSGSLSAVGQ